LVDNLTHNCDDCKVSINYSANQKYALISTVQLSLKYKQQPYFLDFFANSVTIFALDATFVPNLTFLGLLSLKISLGEKTVNHNPAYFAICKPIRKLEIKKHVKQSYTMILKC